MKKIKLFVCMLALMSTALIKVNAQEVTTQAELSSCLNGNGNTCVLANNIEFTSQLVMDDGSVAVLDLNGKKIVPNTSLSLASGLIGMKHGSKLTVNDSVGTGAITSNGNENVYAAIALSINKQDIDDTKKIELIVNGGSFDGYYYAIVGNGTLHRGNTEITINGGTFEGKCEDSSLGIYHPQAGKLTINGGTIKGGTGLEVRAGEVIINGGKIIGTIVPVDVMANGSGSTTDGAGVAISQHTTKLDLSVKITGGTIEGYTALYESNPQNNTATDLAKVTMNVTGGTFNAINNGTVVVYSQDKTGFIKGGTFNKSVDASYVNSVYKVEQDGTNYKVVDNTTVEATIETGKVEFESEEPFDNDYTLSVTEKSDSEVEEATEEVTDKYKDNKNVKDVKFIALYEIDVLDEDSEIVEFDGEGNFTISIPVAENMKDYDTYKVVYFEDGEIVETLDATLVNGKVVFNTTHLSTYGIVGYNNVSSDSVQTSDINLILIMSIALIGGIGLVITAKKRFS